ncbi:hypothetical protein GQ457_04G023390 [Hibiscus cannabinus]
MKLKSQNKPPFPSTGFLAKPFISTFFPGKMDHCNLLQNAAVSPYDHQRCIPVVCPKPRRIGVVANNHNRTLRLHLSYQAEISDMNASSELLDIILKKQDIGIEQTAEQVSSSPPFFCGSPPSRVSNPLVQDALFGDESLGPLQMLTPLSASSLSSYNGGCNRGKFGYKPAAVRVEGFDCLNRDRRNSRIPALA